MTHYQTRKREQNTTIKTIKTSRTFQEKTLISRISKKGLIWEIFLVEGAKTFLVKIISLKKLDRM
jgi:hypothetical protein